MSGNYLNIVSSSVVRRLVLLILGFPIFLFFLFLHLILLIKKIKVYISPLNQAQIKPYKNGKMVDIQTVSSKEQLDFWQHRSPSYIRQLSFGCLWEFSRLVAKQQRIPLIKDDAMCDVIMKSAQSYGLVAGEKGSDVAWRLPFDLERYKLFDGFYWDVKEIVIHHNNQLSLIDRVGIVHTPSSSTWGLAKAHAQVQLSFFAPGMAHNHVHFVFPSLMALYVKTTLSETSVLRQLLEPHTRFTQYINFQALHVNQSSNNTRRFVDRYFKPWLSFPLTADQFLNGIKYKCEKFYYENMDLKQNLNEKIPYQKFLMSYYDICHRFVEQLEPLIKDDYAKLAAVVGEYLPALHHFKPVEVVSTALWNCGVVHFCDHHTYAKFFAMKYACMAMRIPLVREDQQSYQYETSEFDENEYCRFFAPQDVYRTRCFLRTFAVYSPGSDFDLRLKVTQYAFTESLAIKASQEFFQDLVDLDKTLERKDENIVELDKIIRTICF